MARSINIAGSVPARLGMAALLLAIAGGCTTTSGSPGPTSSGLPPTPSLAATPAPSAAALGDALRGTWATGAVTCDQENAALTKAGFTRAQLTAGDWDPTCKGPAAPFTIRFVDGRLVIFENGEVTWDGQYEVTAAGEFKAGDNGTLYLTCRFKIDANRLSVDMVADDFPDQAARLGDSIALTVILESSPFTLQP